MRQTVAPGPRTWRAAVPASKSRAHRLLICAAAGGRETVLKCRGISRDIEATIACLRAMGSEITLGEDGIRVRPIRAAEGEAVLPCGESGSTLRFLLPVCGALGLRGEFRMEGRLPERPLQPLGDLLEKQGMRLRKEGDRLIFSGRLRPGEYEIPGNISSQYISGLLFALPLLPGESRLRVTGNTESAGYIRMTEEALQQFGLRAEKEEKEGNEYLIPGGQGSFGREAKKDEPEMAAKGGSGAAREMTVESDWSSAAFLLALGALSPAGVTVEGMNPESRQGDRAILELLRGFGAEITAGDGEITARHAPLRGQRIDASGIPDLVPVLAAVAAAAEGETVIEHAERLRLKESDRLQTTRAMLAGLGADIRETEDGLRIRGRESLRGGTVSSFRDHRIAMAAAVAASACREPVVIEDAECTEKSYPGFWETLRDLEVIS